MKNNFCRAQRKIETGEANWSDHCIVRSDLFKQIDAPSRKIKITVHITSACFSCHTHMYQEMRINQRLSSRFLSQFTNHFVDYPISFMNWCIIMLGSFKWLIIIDCEHNNCKEGISCNGDNGCLRMFICDRKSPKRVIPGRDKSCTCVVRSKMPTKSLWFC